MSRLPLCAVAGLLVLGLLAPTPAYAGTWRKEASRVAANIGCRHIDSNVITGSSYDAAGCYLRRRYVTVATFRGRGQQAGWLRTVRMYDGWCVASRPGVIVEPENGARRTARIAARRMSGRVVCG